MADRTAVRRVRQYRAVQRNEREIVRADLQVPVAALADLKAIAKALRDRYARIGQARREIDFVLGTVNAPRLGSSRAGRYPSIRRGKRR